MLADRFINNPSNNRIDSVYIEGTQIQWVQTNEIWDRALQRCKVWMQDGIMNNIITTGNSIIHPFGKSRPIASNKNTGRPYKNRRVEIIILRRRTWQNNLRLTTHGSRSTPGNTGVMMLSVRLQEDIITSVLEGKDTLVLCQRAEGNHFCYQVPAMMQDGLLPCYFTAYRPYENQENLAKEYQLLLPSLRNEPQRSDQYI